MHTPSTTALRPTMIIERSTMVQASMLVMTRTACVCTVTRSKAYRSGCASVWTASRVSSQRFLHLRVVRYEFLHNHGHLHWRQTFEAALRCIFSTTGDYLRRMVHQHRRMPLTLCYR